MTKVWLAAALLLAPAFASQALAAESEASAEAPKKEKLICRVDRATGSRVRVNRVCLTRAQWEEVEEQKRLSLKRPPHPRPYVRDDREASL